MHSKNSNHRSGINRTAQRFIVEADISSGDGRFERIGRRGDAVNRFAELPHDFWFFGTAEIQTIGSGDRLRAGTRHIARGFGDRVHRAEAWIQMAPAAIAVGREREGALRSFDAHDRGITRTRNG